MERNIILLGGKPGSGKSRLGRELAKELTPRLSVEHVSIGDTVRKIGTGAINSYYADRIQRHLHNEKTATLPLDDNIVFDVAYDALERSEDIELILLDGYPRNTYQVADVFELAVLHERKISGLIETDVPDSKALTRMMYRNARDYEPTYDDEAARERLARHALLYSDVLLSLTAKNVPIRKIITLGEKKETNTLGIEAVESFIHITEE